MDPAHGKVLETRSTSCTMTVMNTLLSASNLLSPTCQQRQAEPISNSSACTGDATLSSSVPTEMLAPSSSPSPARVLMKQTPLLAQNAQLPTPRELPILRYQYTARNVKVLVGTRWKLKKFETKTIVLLANGGSNPTLVVCAQTPIDASGAEAVTFPLALDLKCMHNGGRNELKLKSTNGDDGFRLKVRFTTAADARIWFNLIQKTMTNARWIQDVEETSCLSKDAMATVVVARHKVSNQNFVIKVLPNIRVDDGSCTEILILKRLFRSAAASMVLAYIHEYRVLETANDVRIVMPKFPGKNLLQFLQQQKPAPHHNLSESEARMVVLRLCEALQALHAVGIVHCDLKLENILLTDVDNVRVIDFGGAYDFSAITDSQKKTRSPQHRMVGTPGYIAPERICNVDEAPTPAADVFSLGIILFQMLTGRQPFARASRHRALSMHDASTLNWQTAEQILASHRISPAARQLIHRMVDPDPRSRIQVDEIFSHAWFC